MTLEHFTISQELVNVNISVTVSVSGRFADKTKTRAPRAESQSAEDPKTKTSWASTQRDLSKQLVKRVPVLSLKPVSVLTAPQLSGLLVLAVGLWLRFDPNTVELLTGDDAPDTFFIGL